MEYLVLLQNLTLVLGCKQAAPNVYFICETFQVTPLSWSRMKNPFPPKILFKFSRILFIFIFSHSLFIFPNPLELIWPLKCVQRAVVLDSHTDHSGLFTHPHISNRHDDVRTAEQLTHRSFFLLFGRLCLLRWLSWFGFKDRMSVK